MSQVILLTACINPSGMSSTALQDPEIRKKQYVFALGFYLEKTQLPIVFVENTNTDISCEFRGCDIINRVEFITFSGNDFDNRKGKGYGEALMIEYALNNSIFLANNSFVIKITGRLIIENIEELVHEMKMQDCVYANMVRGNCGLERKSYFFGAPVEFLRDFFVANKERIDESSKVYFERHLYNECLKWKKTGGRGKEFKRPVLVKGISGSTGKNYPTEKYPRIKALLRYYFHKLPFYSNM